MVVQLSVCEEPVWWRKGGEAQACSLVCLDGPAVRLVEHVLWICLKCIMWGHGALEYGSRVTRGARVSDARNVCLVDHEEGKLST